MWCNRAIIRLREEDILGAEEYKEAEFAEDDKKHKFEGQEIKTPLQK